MKKNLDRVETVLLWHSYQEIVSNNIIMLSVYSTSLNREWKYFQSWSPYKSTGPVDFLLILGFYQGNEKKRPLLKGRMRKKRDCWVCFQVKLICFGKKKTTTKIDGISAVMVTSIVKQYMCSWVIPLFWRGMDFHHSKKKLRKYS